MYKRFVAVKPINTKFGVLPVGTEFMAVNNAIYVNGVMVEPWYYDCIRSILETEMKKPCFLRETAITQNKYR